MTPAGAPGDFDGPRRNIAGDRRLPVAGSSTSGRRILLLMIALFALPPVLATVLYVSGWRPGNTLNHGDLVLPPRAIGDMPLETLDGASIHFSKFRDKWGLVYFGPSTCPSSCLERLGVLRQVQRALGEQSTRIQRILVSTDRDAMDGMQQELHADPGLVVVAASTDSVTNSVRQFMHTGASAIAGERFYLVDPLGNLLMSYPADASPSGMIKDLKRLLTYSWVG